MNDAPPALPHEETPRLLIGSIEDNQKWLTGCPSATALFAFDLDILCDIVVCVPCRRWGCRWCGPRRLYHLAKRVQDAKPDRLITLTLNPAHYRDPRHAYDSSRRQVSELAKVARQKLGSFEYLRVLEVTKAGYPHYHLVVRSKYLEHSWLKHRWETLSGATIVDVRRIEQRRNVCRYVMKYLGKQKAIPWTNRRISFSKNFLIPTEHKKHSVHRWTNKWHCSKGIAEALATNTIYQAVTPIAPGVYVLLKNGETF